MLQYPVIRINLSKIIKKDVAAIKKGEKGNESLTSGYKVVTDNDKLFCLRIDTVIAMGGSQSYAKDFQCG